MLCELVDSSLSFEPDESLALFFTKGFMKNMIMYMLVGNFFSILNVLCIVEESVYAGIFFGCLAGFCYVKALQTKLK